ncbi:hypothetical protein [Nocardia rhizosphaerae]|uniref:Secreted protein n=1 Tax=Nocardia rhizosphaerae TaxID=1691571 RepID=A0ABV8KYW0_9NOCA
MFAKTARPLAVAAIALSVTALGAGPAAAAATTAAPVVGSVSICAGIPVGPFTISVCL